MINTPYSFWEQNLILPLVNGHNISKIATEALPDGTCYYRCPYNNPNDSGAAYVLVQDVPKNVLAPVGITVAIEIITYLIKRYMLYHKELVKSLMKINCDKIDDSGGTLIGHFSNGSKLIVSFDEQECIKDMDNINIPK